MVNNGFDYSDLQSKNVHLKKVNKSEIEECCLKIQNECHKYNQEKQIELLLKSIFHLDLTSLTNTETLPEIEALCAKADNPLPEGILSKLKVKLSDVKCAAVCVYQKYVGDCARILKETESKVSIAAVAGGFPGGDILLSDKLNEVQSAASYGANEVDVVINKNNVIKGDWKALYDEVKAMKGCCGEGVHMKVIIKSGDLESLENVYSASFVCMAAGADFIKTSTGKESVNATLPVGIVMSRAIKHYHEKTGIKVGFKPAGGIRTAEDVLQWMALIKSELGTDWLEPTLFRIGASSLLADIVQHISEYVNLK